MLQERYTQDTNILHSSPCSNSTNNAGAGCHCLVSEFARETWNNRLVNNPTIDQTSYTIKSMHHSCHTLIYPLSITSSCSNLLEPHLASKLKYSEVATPYWLYQEFIIYIGRESIQHCITLSKATAL